MKSTQSAPARWLRIEHAGILTPHKKALEVLVSGLVSMNRRVRFSVVPEVFDHVGQLMGGPVDEQRLHKLDPQAIQQSDQSELVFDLVMADADPGVVAQWTTPATGDSGKMSDLLNRIHRLRLAAWNYPRSVAVCDPDDLAMMVKHMRLNGGRMDLAVRLQLAQKALQQTAAFERAAADCLANAKTG